MRTFLVVLTIAKTISFATAQHLPHYDILFFSVQKMPDSIWRLAAPRFLTSFNPQGYNNQPCFFSNSELYVTVQVSNDTAQTDIYALDLFLKTKNRVTATPNTAEYSPTLMPGGKRFSVVRVEEDGTQRLWSFPLDRSDNGRPEFPKISGVGYHCWLRDTLVALFIIGENGTSHTLCVVGTKKQTLSRIASNVGRCLQITPDGQLAFTTEATENSWFLKKWDLKKSIPEIVAILPLNSEDFAVLPDGTFLAGSGAKLFQYKSGISSDWKEIANLSRYGVKNISRIAVSRDGKSLTVVVE